MVAILAATASGRAQDSNRHLLSTIVALGLLTSSAAIIDISGGAVEAHFHFFVIMSVLLLYEDSLPYAAAFAYVVLHQGTIGVLGSQSATTTFMALGRNSRSLHHRSERREHRELARQRSGSPGE